MNNRITRVVRVETNEKYWKRVYAIIAVISGVAILILIIIYTSLPSLIRKIKRQRKETNLENQSPTDRNTSFELAKLDRRIIETQHTSNKSGMDLCDTDSIKERCIAIRGTLVGTEENCSPCSKSERRLKAKGLGHSGNRELGFKGWSASRNYSCLSKSTMKWVVSTLNYWCCC